MTDEEKWARFKQTTEVVERVLRVGKVVPGRQRLSRKGFAAWIATEVLEDLFGDDEALPST